MRNINLGSFAKAKRSGLSSMCYTHSTHSFKLFAVHTKLERRLLIL